MRFPRALDPCQTAKLLPPLAVCPRAGNPDWKGAYAAWGGHTAKTAKGHGAPPVLAVWPPGGRPGPPSVVRGKLRKGRPTPQKLLDRAPSNQTGLSPTKGKKMKRNRDRVLSAEMKR